MVPRNRSIVSVIDTTIYFYWGIEGISPQNINQMKEPQKSTQYVQSFVFMSSSQTSQYVPNTLYRSLQHSDGPSFPKQPNYNQYQFCIKCVQYILSPIIFNLNSMVGDILQQYLAAGIIQSDIREDGGQECYHQIPYSFHLYFNSLLIFIHLLLVFRWNRQMNSHCKALKFLERDQEYEQKECSWLEIVVGLTSILSLVGTAYYKFITKKGLFMLNPCHVTLLIMVLLLFSKATPIMQKIHTYWTSWLFGAYLALMMPHLYGISNFQIFLYYYEHILIVPLGPLILNRRYGFLKPNLTNHVTAFSSIMIYQVGILAPMSRIFMVNLNFTLCHSPADPFYDKIGYYYFAVATIHLNMASYVFRWFTYLQIRMANWVSSRRSQYGNIKQIPS